MPDEILNKAIAAALEAPTACNRVPYRFIVTRGEEASRVAGFAGGTTGYGEGLTGLVTVVGDLSAYSEPRDRHLIYIDSSLASMSFVLAIEAAGGSTCCINWPDVRWREKKIADYLELKRYERVIMLIAFGYGDPDILVPSSAKPEMSHVVRYLDGGGL